MDAILRTYLLVALAVFIYMSGWYAAALILKRNDIVDIAWGIGFLVVSATSLVVNWPPHVRFLLVAALVLVWSLRLALHIGIRNRGAAEDFRYAAWRKEWGKWFYVRTYLQVFLLQGLFMLMIAAPIVIASADAGPALGWLDAAGVAVWAIGFYFESVGDAQLAAFRRNPENKGHLIETGLWRYTRHPNYFGEAVQWWGLAIIALSAPSGWLALIGPITITLLLRFVSGVPMLEKKYAGRPDWEAYKAKTSVLIPLPPKKG